MMRKRSQSCTEPEGDGQLTVVRVTRQSATGLTSSKEDKLTKKNANKRLEEMKSRVSYSARSKISRHVPLKTVLRSIPTSKSLQELAEHDRSAFSPPLSPRSFESASLISPAQIDGLSSSPQASSSAKEDRGIRSHGEDSIYSHTYKEKKIELLQSRLRRIRYELWNSSIDEDDRTSSTSPSSSTSSLTTSALEEAQCSSSSTDIHAVDREGDKRSSGNIRYRQVSADELTDSERASFVRPRPFFTDIFSALETAVNECRGKGSVDSSMLRQVAARWLEFNMNKLKEVWTEKGSENDVGMWMKDVCALILSADVGRTVAKECRIDHLVLFAVAHVYRLTIAVVTPWSGDAGLLSIRPDDAPVKMADLITLAMDGTGGWCPALRCKPINSPLKPPFTVSKPRLSSKKAEDDSSESTLSGPTALMRRFTLKSPLSSPQNSGAMSTSPPTKTVRHKRSRSQEIVTHHDVPNLLRVSGVITAHPQSNVGDNVAYYSDVDEDMIMGGHFDEDASSGSAVLATRVFSDPACQNTLREAFSDPESNSDVGRSFSKEEMIFSKDDASTEGTSSGDGSEKPSRDPRDFMKKVATSIRDNLASLRGDDSPKGGDASDTSDSEEEDSTDEDEIMTDLLSVEGAKPSPKGRDRLRRETVAASVASTVAAKIKDTRGRTGSLKKGHEITHQPKHPAIIIPVLEVWEGKKSWQLERVWMSAAKIRDPRWLATAKQSSSEDWQRDWLQHILLMPDGFSDPPGIRVRAQEGLRAIDYISREPGIKTQSWVFAHVIGNLADIGYDSNSLISGAYDWRLSPMHLEKRDRYFSMLTAKIELCSKHTGLKVCLVAHSMGVQVAHYFCHWIGREWLDKYVHSFIAVGPPWLGAPRALRCVLSGEKLGLEMFLLDREAILFARNCGSAPLIFPLREGEIDGWGPFVYLRSGPREPSLPIDIDTALKTGGAEATAMHYSEYYKKDPLFLATEEDETPKILQPPPVNRLYNIYGVGLESETHFYLRYKKKPTSNILVCADHHVREDNADFRVDAKGIGYEKPSATRQTGDGTVPYKSLSYAQYWKDDIPICENIELQGVEHREILRSNLFLDKLRELIAQPKVQGDRVGQDRSRSGSSTERLETSKSPPRPTSPLKSEAR